MCWWDSKIPRWILIWFKTDYALKIFQREDRFSCALSFTTCVTLTSCQFSLNFVFLFNQIEIMPKEFQGQRSLVGYSPWHHKELDMIVQLTFFSLSFVLQYVIRIIKKKKKGEKAQSCLTLCDPMNYSLPGSSVHGIFQARVLEWVAIAFSNHKA